MAACLVFVFVFVSSGESGGLIDLAAHVFILAQEPEPERLPFGDIGAREHGFVDPPISVIKSPLQRVTPSLCVRLARYRFNWRV